MPETDHWVFCEHSYSI